MNTESCRYTCIICNKNYSSANSLWNHNKKFHTNNIPLVLNSSINILNTSNHIKTYNCRCCNKIFNNVKTRWAHEQKCKKNKIQENNKIEILENKIKELENKMNNNKSITQNNSNNTTNNNNNGTINNITINQFGNENIHALSVKEIKQLIKNDNYLIDIIKLLNFNEKYPENHNFCNTSLEGKYISIFNSDTNKIEKINKNDFYDKVLSNSFTKMDNLSIVLELNEDVREQIKDKYIDYLDSKLTHIKNVFYKDKIYKKSYKTNINELSYNKNKVVLDTWANITDTFKKDNEDDNQSESDKSCNSKYSAFTTDSSESE